MIKRQLAEGVSKRRVGVYGPSLGRRQVVMVDDLHLPAHDEYGCQPPIELLRQWMDYGGWYDRGDRAKTFRRILDVQFVAAMGPVTVGQPSVTSRYLRHFNALSFVACDEAAMTHMFSCILRWYLDASLGEVGCSLAHPGGCEL